MFLPIYPMKVIFLDCDGVLNSDQFFQGNDPTNQKDSQTMKFGVGQLDHKGLALIDQIVNATGAKIVICSSWRLIWPWHEIAEMFGDVGFKNQHEIFDETPHSGKNADTRGDEIRQWLELDREREEVGEEITTSYVIIDDNNEFDTEQQQFYVQTNPRTGITQADAAKAIAILNRS